MKSIVIAADYAEDIEASVAGQQIQRDDADLLQSPVRDDEMLGLFRALQACMPQKSHWTLGVTSTRSGEGVSSVARGLARVVARTPKARVLICDVARDSAPQQHRALPAMGNARGSYGDGPGRIEFSFLPGSHQIAVGSFSEAGLNAMTSDIELVRSMVRTVSANFELVILDLPPVSESVVSPALANAVDGVVLVVEAERTRAQSVRAAHHTLQMYGGNVLGVVLNKRRFHIPDSIYRAL